MKINHDVRTTVSLAKCKYKNTKNNIYVQSLLRNNLLRSATKQQINQPNDFYGGDNHLSAFNSFKKEQRNENRALSEKSRKLARQASSKYFSPQISLNTSQPQNQQPSPTLDLLKPPTFHTKNISISSLASSQFSNSKIRPSNRHKQKIRQHQKNFPQCKNLTQINLETPCDWAENVVCAICDGTDDCQKMKRRTSHVFV
jgi:hypothetical protein